MNRGLVTGAETGDGGARGQDGDGDVRGEWAVAGVALWGPEMKCVVPEEPGLAVEFEESAGGERGQWSAVGDLATSAVDAGGVKDEVHFIGAGKRLAPCGAEGVVVSATAFGAGPMSGGKRDGFIEEEELGIAIGSHYDAVAIAEFENAGDPAA